MLFIKHEYDAGGDCGLEVQPDVVFGPPHRRQRVVVAAQAMSRAVVQAVKVGETMGEEVQLVHVTLDPAEGECFRERVERQLPGVRVVLVESPYRALVRPFVQLPRGLAGRGSGPADDRAAAGASAAPLVGPRSSTTRTCTAFGRPWSGARTS